MSPHIPCFLADACQLLKFALVKRLVPLGEIPNRYSAVILGMCAGLGVGCFQVTFYCLFLYWRGFFPSLGVALLFLLDDSFLTVSMHALTGESLCSLSHSLFPPSFSPSSLHTHSLSTHSLPPLSLLSPSLLSFSSSLRSLSSSLLFHLSPLLLSSLTLACHHMLTAREGIWVGFGVTKRYFPTKIVTEDPILEEEEGPPLDSAVVLSLTKLRRVLAIPVAFNFLYNSVYLLMVRLEDLGISYPFAVTWISTHSVCVLLLAVMLLYTVAKLRRTYFKDSYSAVLQVANVDANVL